MAVKVLVVLFCEAADAVDARQLEFELELEPELEPSTSPKPSVSSLLLLFVLLLLDWKIGLLLFFRRTRGNQVKLLSLLLAFALLVLVFFLALVSAMSSLESLAWTKECSSSLELVLLVFVLFDE